MTTTHTPLPLTLDRLVHAATNDPDEAARIGETYPWATLRDLLELDEALGNVHTCGCGRPGELTLDPFDSAVHEEIVPTILCQDCHDLRVEEI